MIRIGIVGHRNLNDSGLCDFVAGTCHTIFKKARDKYSEVVAISALAEGADTVFAEAACGLGIPLDVVRPFKNYETDFPKPADLNRYLKLRNAARRETILKHDSRSTDAYLAAMRWVLRRSDFLVVVWDGQASGGKGGTAEAAKYATRHTLPFVHLNTLDQSVTYKCGGQDFL